MSGVIQSNATQTISTPLTFEFGDRTFAPASAVPIPERPCTTPSQQQQQPTLTLKDDDLFLITDTLGNIAGCFSGQVDRSLGLFCQDARYLSRLELQIERQLPILLSSTAQRGFALTVLCTNPALDDRVPAKAIGIQRDIVLKGGVFEELTLTNYTTQPAQFELSLSFDADFADLFEIRGYRMRSQKGTLLRQIQHTLDGSIEHCRNGRSPCSDIMELTLAYQGLDEVLMESRIQFYRNPPHRLDGYTAIWNVTLDAHEQKVLGYQLQPFLGNRSASSNTSPATLKQAVAAETSEEERWRERIACIRTDNETINQMIERGEEDLYLLGQTFGGYKVLAAGTPWFSTLFGRDSIISASQTLMLDPQIACQTLQALAQYQGKTYDEWREEEPGKILHELRFGEMARCGEIPHTPYYGTIDATPLWLMLYADYYAWMGDRDLIDQLWDNALLAMDWIDRHCQQTGYLAYQRISAKGLNNQGWKDSDSCLVNGKGEMAQGAIALSEVQGYVYAAKVRMSRIARIKQRPDLADRWQQEAKSLKERFEQDFWLPAQNYVAFALDGDGNLVDSITSNPGHCLGLGILSPDKARQVVERLQAPDMFSGWGIRTLSSDSPAYNPMGYHVGAVWPHDNSMIAVGLRSLGFIDETLKVAQALIDMAAEQPYFRPPELFCGFERTPKSSPVRYPVACSPQAWATGSLFQMLHLMVNLVPDVPNRVLRVVHPTLPKSIQYLSIKNLKIGDAILHLEFERSSGATACRVVNKQGNLNVMIEA